MFSLIQSSAPLYLYILVGYIIGCLVDLNTKRLSSLLFYGISPIVIFCGIVSMPLDAAVLAFPLFVWCASVLAAIFMYRISGKFVSGSSQNLLSYSCGTGNSGYFGLPVAISVFDSATAGVYLLGLLGHNLYENTAGFYIAARGTYSAKESIKKVFRLPTLYASILAVYCNFSGWQLPRVGVEVQSVAVFLYSVLGMTIIGIALSKEGGRIRDWVFVGLALLGRWVVWPVVASLIFILSFPFLGDKSDEIVKSLILLAVVPVAANTVVFASLLHAPVQKMATSVLVSTLVALIYVPFMIWLQTEFLL